MHEIHRMLQRGLPEAWNCDKGDREEEGKEGRGEGAEEGEGANTGTGPRGAVSRGGHAARDWRGAAARAGAPCLGGAGGGAAAVGAPRDLRLRVEVLVPAHLEFCGP